MSVIKLNLLQQLIEDYVKTPPSLKEQTGTKVALLICQHVELKKIIISVSEKARKGSFPREWVILIDKLSSWVCEKVPLTRALKILVIYRIRQTALQIIRWNTQQEMFYISSVCADNLLTSCDWTAERRLDDQKIAERLVQDEAIPACYRYRMACIHCLKSSIPSLWNETSSFFRELYSSNEENELIRLWSYKLDGRVEELIPHEDHFWRNLLERGVRGGSRSTVIHCWGELHLHVRQGIVIGAAMAAVSQIYRIIDGNDSVNILLLSLVPFLDILSFLLTQMSKEERVAFFQEALQDTRHNVLACFLQWPYADLLIPIINELWSILPAEKYRGVLSVIARIYSGYSVYSNGRNIYSNYDYESLMIDLLEEAPDHFKRFVFDTNYNSRGYFSSGGELIFMLLNKIKTRDIKIFQSIWRHITLEEKRLFLKTLHGAMFCYQLAEGNNCELLNRILIECLPENAIPLFKTEISRHESQILEELDRYPKFISSISLNARNFPI